MRILLYSYNFSPEKTGIGKYNGELAEWLAQRGHQVDVITAPPYYPEWQVHEEYLKNKWKIERTGNLSVYRCPMYIPSKVTGKARLISEFSFLISSFIVWQRLAITKPRYDVVLSLYPPLTGGMYPYIYSRLFRSFLTIHVQDLQLDAAEQLGLIKSKLLLNCLKPFERFFLRKAHLVSSISEGMKMKLIQKGTHIDNYFMLENWVDTSFIKPVPRVYTSSLRSSFGLKETDKVILYSGNIGEKQGLETVLDAANHLANYQDWKFVICGTGVSRLKLEGLSQDQKQTNVLFRSLVPYDQLPALLSLADVHLVPQKLATADLVLPSKLTGILAAGGLAIVSAEIGTTMHSTVTDNDMGIVVEPENSSALAAAIKRALTENFDVQKENALHFAQTHLNRDNILLSYEESLAKRCKDII